MEKKKITQSILMTATKLIYMGSDLDSAAKGLNVDTHALGAGLKNHSTHRTSARGIKQWSGYSSKLGVPVHGSIFRVTRIPESVMSSIMGIMNQRLQASGYQVINFQNTLSIVRITDYMAKVKNPKYPITEYPLQLNMWFSRISNKMYGYVHVAGATEDIDVNSSYGLYLGDITKITDSKKHDGLPGFVMEDIQMEPRKLNKSNRAIFSLLMLAI